MSTNAIQAWKYIIYLMIVKFYNLFYNFETLTLSLKVI